MAAKQEKELTGKCPNCGWSSSDKTKKQDLPPGVLGECPKCGKGVIADKRNYHCEDAPKCKFAIAKSTDGAKFDEDMIKKLLNGEKLGDVSCFTSDGVEYKAGFRIDEKGNFGKLFYGAKR